jgi:hypothetical protein
MLAPIRLNALSRTSFPLEDLDEVVVRAGFLAAELPVKICVDMAVSPVCMSDTMKRLNGHENSDKRHKGLYVGGRECILV